MRELEVANLDCLLSANSDIQAIVTVAPAEGLHPVSMLSLANTADALQDCLSKFIPYGDFCFNVERPVKLIQTQLIRWCEHYPKITHSMVFVCYAQHLRLRL